MVQQGAIAVGRRLELLHVIGEQLGLQRFDLDHLLDLRAVAGVMRQGVMRVGNPDLGEGSICLLTAHHEGNDAGDIGLEGQNLQVTHQLGMFLVRGGDTDRPLHPWHLQGTLLLGHLDATLDIANGVGILGQLRPIARTEFPHKVRYGLAHRVENAAIPSEAGTLLLRVRALDVAKQPLEDSTWIVFHRERCRGTLPAQRVDIGAAPAAFARAYDPGGIETDLERRQLRVLAEFLRNDLIERNSIAEVGAIGPLRLDTCQIRTGGALVNTHLLPGQRSGLFLGESRQHSEPIAKRGERLQEAGQFEVDARRRRCPLVHDPPVRHVHDAQSLRRFNRTRTRERRNHGVQEG